MNDLSKDALGKANTNIWRFSGGYHGCVCMDGTVPYALIRKGDTWGAMSDLLELQLET